MMVGPDPIQLWYIGEEETVTLSEHQVVMEAEAEKEYGLLFSDQRTNGYICPESQRERTRLSPA